MNIAIADDNMADIALIKKYLQEFTAEEPEAPLFEIAEFVSADQLLAYDGNIDILFLDIEYGDVKGTEIVGSLLCNRSNDVIVVFISAYPAYVSSTYQVNAFGFLTKPIAKERFNIELKRCLKRYDDQQEILVRRSFNEAIEINKSQIVMLEARKRMIHLQLNDGHYVEYYGRISDEAKQLDRRFFIRCHRGIIVNLAYVKAITKEQEVLLNFKPNGSNDFCRVPIGNKYKKLVESAFLNYLASHK